MTGAWGMTGASPVTTIYGIVWLRHVVAHRCIVVTGLAPVMPRATLTFDQR